MLTRAQKRRVGERDLWDVIVNNDDICFKHILPRLNPTDIKFLYEVNSETRALVKRSSRKDDLKKRFKVNEMSSISTLEFAWEDRSKWSWILDERRFCSRVAETNKLELLKWVREVKKCVWDEWTIYAAAGQGNLEMIKYCVAIGCPNDTAACSRAAFYGHLECLKYLHETAKAPWDGEAVRNAHKYHQPECLQYLLEKDCPLPRGWWYEDGTLFGEPTITQAAIDGNLEMVQYCVAKNCPIDGWACAFAASYGHLEILKYLHEDVNAPWDWHTATNAAGSGNLHILEYLVESDYGFTETFPCYNAARHGHLDCLKYLHETAKAPWDSWAVRFALEKNHSECLQYLLDNNCPLPEGWRYEHGKLYT